MAALRSSHILANYFAPLSKAFYAKESAVFFKRAETYFYFMFVIWLLKHLGQEPESISINLGFITFNNLKFSNLDLWLSVLCIAAGAACVIFNFEIFRRLYSNQVEYNENLVSHITNELQSVTGSSRDRVSKVSMLGIFNVSPLQCVFL